MEDGGKSGSLGPNQMHLELCLLSGNQVQPAESGLNPSFAHTSRTTASLQNGKAQDAGKEDEAHQPGPSAPNQSELEQSRSRSWQPSWNEITAAPSRASSATLSRIGSAETWKQTVSGWVKEKAVQVTGWRAHKKLNQDLLKRFMHGAVREAEFRIASGSETSVTASVDSVSLLNSPPDGRVSHVSERNADLELLKQFLHAKRVRSSRLEAGPAETTVGAFQAWVDGMYFRACMRPPCLQDERLEDLRHKATWFRPLLESPNADTRCFFRVCVLVVAAVMAADAASATAALYVSGLWKVTAAQFRFVPVLGQESGQEASAMLSSVRLSLLWNGCTVTSPHQISYDAEHPSATVTFESQQDVSGWCAEALHSASALSSSPSQMDAAFRVMAWDTHAETWKDVASAVWRTALGSVVRLDRRGVAARRLGCHETHPGLEYTLSEVLLPWLTVGLLLLAMLREWRGAAESANRVLVLTLAIASAVYVLVGALASGQDGGEAAMMSWVRAGLLAAALLVLRRPRTNLHFWAAVLALTNAAAVVVERTVLFDAAATLAKAFEVYVALALAAVAAGVEVRRRGEYVRALARVCEDAARGDAVWEALQASDARCLEAMRAIEQRALSCGDLSLIPAPQQRRGHLEDAGPEADELSVQSAARPLPPLVRSIDQLHFQAALLLPVLRERVQFWALHSRGWVRLKESAVDVEVGGAGSRFVLWEDVTMGQRTADDVQWTEPKAFTRAIQKVVELYSCEVSRLCDMARESLWFETLADVVTCLETIAADPQCVVEGVKNAMTPGRSSGTGGFRFVKVLVRLQGDYTSELALDGHVCELLLLLKEGEAARSPDTHRRYLDFRTARARDSRLLNPTLGPDLVQSALRRASVALGLTPSGALARRGTWRRQSSMRSSTSRYLASDIVLRQHSRSRSEDLQGREGGAGQEEAAEAGEAEGAAMRSDCQQAMRRYMAELNAGEPGEVGKRAKNVTEAVARAASGSVFRMQRPVAALLCKRKWQAMVFIAGSVGLLSSLLLLAAPDAQPSGRIFRFTNLETREGAAPVGPGILSFSLQRGSCPISRPHRTWINGTSMLLEFEEAVSYSAWSLYTAETGSVRDDAVRFTLEALRDGDGSWELVGASSRFRILKWPTHFEPQKRFEVPEARGHQVVFQQGNTWAEHLQPIGSLIVGVTMLSVGLCGLLHKQLLAVRLIKVLIGLAQVPPFASASILFSNGHEREGWHVAMWGVGGVLWVTLFSIKEGWFLEAFLLTGMLSIANTAVVQLVVYEAESWVAAVDVFGVIYMVIGGGCRLYSLFNDWHVAQVYFNDCHMYQGIWRQVLRDDQQRGALEDLRALTDSIKPPTTARQRGIPWQAQLDQDPLALQPMWWSACALLDSKGCFPVCPPAASIDQLYAQAQVAAVVLRYKVMAWGRRSGGQCLLADREGGGGPRLCAQFVKLSELSCEDEPRVQWGKVKAPLRALEKAHRCYGGDVSRLCDLARHSLVFDTPEELLRCVEVVANDAEVQVLRVKNSLHATEESSSGYRQVLINLTIVSDWTEHIGTSMHVSEVQLLLREFALAKTLDGHRRYVAVRNGRGE